MDPIFAQLNKAALDKITVEKPGAGAPGTGTSPFQNVLNNQIGQTNSSEDATTKLTEFVDKTFGIEKGGMNANAIDASSVHVEVTKTAELDRTPKANHIFDILQDVNKDTNQLESLKELASSGKTFKPQELLAMQVGIGQATMMVDMVGKGIEVGLRGIQTITGMQIG
jgi:hypothetical protein